MPFYDPAASQQRASAGLADALGGFLTKVHMDKRKHKAFQELRRLNTNQHPEMYAAQVYSVLDLYGLEPGPVAASQIAAQANVWRQSEQSKEAERDRKEAQKKEERAAEEGLATRLAAGRLAQEMGAPEYISGAAVRLGGPTTKDILAMYGERPLSPDVGAGGATGVLIRQLREDNPGMTFTEALHAFQTGMRQNLVRNPDGSVSAVPGAPGALGELKRGEETGRQEAVLEYAAPIAGATVRGKAEEEGRLGLPDQFRRAERAQEAANLVVDAIKEARKKANWMSTGIMAQLTKGIGQTPAFNLNQLVETIRSNIGFDKLQLIRDQSPTGGALGPVSDFENKLLQATMVSLETAQDKDQFLRALDIVENQYTKSMERLWEAYQQDVARFGKDAVPAWTFGPVPTQQPVQEPGKAKDMPPPFPGTRRGQRARSSDSNRTWVWDGKEWK